MPSVSLCSMGRSTEVQFIALPGRHLRHYAASPRDIPSLCLARPRARFAWTGLVSWQHVVSRWHEPQWERPFVLEKSADFLELAADTCYVQYSVSARFMDRRQSRVGLLSITFGLAHVLGPPRFAAWACSGIALDSQPKG